MPRITQRTVAALTPEGGRDAFIWDASVTGFGVRARPSGVKTYILKYTYRRRQRWLSIGRHGSPWTAEMARNEAKRLLGEVIAGRDPAARRDREREAKTVAELCNLYLAEGCPTAKGGTKKPTSKRSDKSRITNHIIPLLGRLLVPNVTPRDVEQMRDAIAVGKTAHDIKTVRHGRSRVTGGPGAAKQTVMLLSAMFTFAIKRKLLTDNPAFKIWKAPGRTYKRYLSPAEQLRLGEALVNAQDQGANPTAIMMIRLLALTGMRLGEVRLLRWSEVDAAHSCLHLADSKTGSKTVPLGAAALQLILSRPKADPTYVFPSSSLHHKPWVDPTKVWRRIRTAAGLKDVRLHDLRHSFASNIVSAGGSLPLIAALLGHKNIRTTERYAHLADDPVKRIADQAAHAIAAALDGAPQESGEVRPLRR